MKWRMPHEEGPVLPSPSGHWQSCHACHVCRAAPTSVVKVALNVEHWVWTLKAADR
jgi:hypothetical protein